jgi:pyruvate dehydrogenase E2 component (dihydrolipoamide acetyltransferase)
MGTDLRLPLLGDIMTEGRLVSWLQPDGAEVRAGQPLYELETDKVSFTVEAPVAGVLRKIVAAGELVEVGTVVGQLLEAGEAGAEPAEGEADSLASPFAPTITEVLATPAARRLARDLGVDLAALGATGRIREADVRAWHEASVGFDSRSAVAPPPVAAERSIPYGGRRRAIGERMVLSQRTAAALTLSSEVNVDAALEMVEGLNQEWVADGAVLTLTRLIVKACALALREHPFLNSRLEGDRILLLDHVDIGVAVDQEAGLIVPVVSDVDRLSLKDVARELRELTQRAEAGQLTQADVKEGTFTVTSLASSVVDAFTPIINPPQAAILGIGRVREIAAFGGSASTGVTRRRVTTLSLTFDHRVCDGAPASRFVGRVAELLLRPYLLMA